MYFLKGHGRVETSYHPAYRAYEYRIQGKSFLSMGPGWAYSEPYLKSILEASYNHYYMPKSGDTVVDIGAGLGEETLFYAILVGEKGRVHALEANPVTFAGLQYVCRRNGFSWVTTHNTAIFNTDGEVT